MGVPEEEIVKTLLTSSTEAEIKKALKRSKEEYVDKGDLDEDEEIGKGVERGSMFVGKATRVMDYKTAIAAQKLLVDFIKLKRSGKPVRNVLERYTKRRRGRPPKYSKELADRICNRIARGEMLINICMDDDMPHVSTVYEWIEKNSDFSDSYARARRTAATVYVEQGLVILDNSTPDDIQVNTSRANYRKWMAEKCAPAEYGDRKSVALEGGDTPVKLAHTLPAEAVAPLAAALKEIWSEEEES